MKQRGLAAAVLISVLMHAAVIGLFLYEPTPEPHEPIVVEAIPVELFRPPPEPAAHEDAPEATLQLPSPELAAVPEAAESAPPEEAATAPQTPEAANPPEASEAAEAALPPPEPAPSENANASGSPPADHGDAAEQPPAGNASGASQASAPPVPVNLNIGTPDTLEGDSGAGPEAPGDVADTETPERTADPSDAAGNGGPGAAETAPAPQSASTRAELASQAPPPAQSEQTDRGQSADADRAGAAVSRLAAANVGTGTPADIANTDERPANQLTPLPEAPDANEADNADAEPDAAPPVPDPTDTAQTADDANEPDSENAPNSLVEPSQLAFNEALRSALDDDPTGGGGALNAQVAYTEAVRSAIAPRFWTAMRAVRESGIAVVEVVILRNGSVRSTRIVQSSGVAAIDDASLEAARSTSYPSLPDSIGREQLTVHIPLRVR